MLAHWAAAQLRAAPGGGTGARGGMEDLARRAGVSPRHLRRLVREHLGVSPVQLAQTARLLTAKHLLTGSRAPIERIARASGFGSLRRMQTALRTRYGLSASRIRGRPARAGADGLASGCASGLRVRLAYRPPLDWARLLRFLGGRAIPGVELVSGDSYARTWRSEGALAGAGAGGGGWWRARPADQEAELELEISDSLTERAAEVIACARRLFDLDAQPAVIAEALSEDPLLAPMVAGAPGLRAPGAADGFELGLRAILGQQVSVAAARTLAGRVAASFGEPVGAPLEGLDRFTPRAERLAAARPAELSALGLTTARAGCVVELARRVTQGELMMAPAPDPLGAIKALQACPGIGPWTAQYIAMRALRWPDAFPAGDLVLRRALGGLSERRAEEASARWRPWRAYAAMHIWRRFGEAKP